VIAEFLVCEMKVQVMAVSLVIANQSPDRGNIGNTVLRAINERLSSIRHFRRASAYYLSQCFYRCHFLLLNHHDYSYT
jgi:hypothetical protein